MAVQPLGGSITRHFCLGIHPAAVQLFLQVDPPEDVKDCIYSLKIMEMEVVRIRNEEAARGDA